MMTSANWRHIPHKLSKQNPRQTANGVNIAHSRRNLPLLMRDAGSFLTDMSQFAILDPFRRKVRQSLPPNEAPQDAQSGIREFRRSFAMPKPRSRFLILHACATL